MSCWRAQKKKKKKCKVLCILKHSLSLEKKKILSIKKKIKELGFFSKKIC